MSIERCHTHDRNWDSDFHEECPTCRFLETQPPAVTGPHEGLAAATAYGVGANEAPGMPPSFPITPSPEGEKT